MKCPHCGSPIRLEDKYCSYCGLPNDLAAQHQKDMNQYRKKFNQTRSEVLKSTRRTREKIASFVVLAVMILLIIGSYQVEEHAWDVENWLTRRQIQLHKNEYITALDQIIEDQDPLQLGTYFEQHSLYLDHDFHGYYAVKNVSDYYESVFRYAAEQLTDDEDSDADSRARALRYLANSLSEIFQVEENYDYDTELYFSGNRLDYVHAVQDDTKALLITYFGLTPEEADSFADLSAARQYTLLERSLDPS